MGEYALKKLLLTLILVLINIGTTSAAPIDEASAAYDKKDYERALKLLKPLAVQGNVDAQYLLSRLYQDGKGVPQDYEEALKWYRLAAAQGNSDAQESLKHPEMVAAAKDDTVEAVFRKAGERLGNGIANMAFGFLELPKSVILTTHNEGLASGIPAGIMIGITQSFVRTLQGVIDVAMFMIPTKSLAYPDYIWKDFDRETRNNLATGATGLPMTTVNNTSAR